MSNHTESVTLERIAHMLGQFAVEQLQIKQHLESIQEQAKTRYEKVSGQLQALQGEVNSHSGKLDVVAGKVASLTAAVEALETAEGKTLATVAKLQTEMQGLTHLCKTTFDVHVSLLEQATGSKGADRPKSQSRPSRPGGA